MLKLHVYDKKWVLHTIGLVTTVLFLYSPSYTFTSQTKMIPCNSSGHPQTHRCPLSAHHLPGYEQCGIYSVFKVNTLLLPHFVV